MARSARKNVNQISKTCTACGRKIEWRKKWANNWDNVRYCSGACRRHGLRTIDNDLASAIKSLLDGQPRGTTICPSEAARLVARDDGSDLDGWRYLMEPTLSAARRLVAEGRLEIVQRGKVVDPSTAKGPIRLRRRSAP